jgi:hypothetical protein
MKNILLAITLLLSALMYAADTELCTFRGPDWATKRNGNFIVPKGIKAKSGAK